LLALSLDRRFGTRGQTFYLTIAIPDFDGPGPYPEGAAVAQVTGLGNVSRWSNRELRIHVAADGSVELGRAALAPELGTPASGRLTIAGRARCKG
jgi:hypothetical protein